MLGLFGTLNLATRSLSTQRQGTEVAGHNLANVNNPAYTRQRLAIEASLPIPTNLGPQGSGAEGVAILQIRNTLLDRQILSETSVRGSLASQQQALQYAQANLGQFIDRQSGAETTTTTSGSGQHGLAEELSGLFNAFQGLSTNPTSLAERQVLVIKAQNLATQFNQVDSRLNDVNQLLNNALQTDVDQANSLLTNIAKLNEQIVTMEMGGAGLANDLRDVRQQRLEELASLVNLTTTPLQSGAINVTISGVTMISGSLVIDTLQTYDAGAGQLLLQSQTANSPISLSGGSLHGTLTARDGALAGLRTEINLLASQLISSVNNIHTPGFGLNGTTGDPFFSGSNAATIAVNSSLVDDPSRIQAAASPNAQGDNSIALSLAQLAQQNFPALSNQSLSQHYNQSVARLGQSLASLNAQFDNQNIVETMLLRQRDSVSGVSLDEEMTDLVRFQRAFEASARLISVVDSMLDTVINLRR